MPSDAKRIQLACKYCFKMTERLSGHLRSSCKKGADNGEILLLVQEAKANMRSLVSNLAVVQYQQLKAAVDSDNALNSFVEFLESKGCLISDKPSGTHSTLVPAEEEQENPKEEEEETEIETLPSTSNVTTSVKKIMKAAGLYKKHSVKSTLLLGFKKYLRASFSKSHINYNVAIVSRYLHYMNPHVVSVSCLHNIERTMQFFNEFGTLTIARKTVLNYIRAIKTFVRYINSEDKFLEKDPSLRRSIETFLKRMNEALVDITKTATKKPPERKASTPEECQEVLNKTHPYFMEVIDQANSGHELEERDRIFVLHYLESLLVLQKLHRGFVMQNMTVDQWLERSHLEIQDGTKRMRVAVIKVKKNSDEPHNVVLQRVEEIWFDTFFTKIRPTFLKGESSYFFISSNGEKIINPTTDIRSFQNKFKVHVASWQDTRSIFEKFIIPSCDVKNQELLRKYLKSDLKIKNINISEFLQAAVMVSNLQKTWVQPSTSRDRQLPTTMDTVKDETFPRPDEKMMCYKYIENNFPVGLDRVGPTLKECKNVTDMHGHYCYDRWRRKQVKLRMDDVIGHFRHTKPNVYQIKRHIKSRGWTNRIPMAKEVLENWEAKSPLKKAGQ
ncbi:uncharacterized protein LOC734527 [Xenopus laevis]|uniref:MGC115216 protein n=2 Tax=Xenopus laevis TaxID=8355 RepID=Q4V7W9_XENLA|nr:uncharacterized protein LOC734527 [Xenopus laevis]AAH97684.1 MGC115216 protein [Xenopus laevis]OCT83571.1 hypothetical protein XELAEV_18021713mg [Xenopus laevis]